MAQSTPLRGRSWTGSPQTLPVSLRSVRNERHRELKQQEQEARKRCVVINSLEAEISDLSETLQRLQKQDAERLQRLNELSTLLGTDKATNDVPSVENSDSVGRKENGWARVEQSDSEETSEGVLKKLGDLKDEHEAAQNLISSTKASLEQKRVQLKLVSGEYQALTDQIATEEVGLQSADTEESLKHSDAVQYEMRSLSDDLGRLGRMMQGLNQTIGSDQLKQSSRRSQKPRIYHPVTSSRSTSNKWNFQNGGATDLGRNTDRGRNRETRRVKDPNEFEERESPAGGGGCNRKRQKSSTFELEAEGWHDPQVKAGMTAKETLLETVAGLTSDAKKLEANKGESSAVLSSSLLISSPSSVFEGFEEIASVGPVRSGSMGSASASSEVSSEFSLEKGLFLSAIEPLDFGSSEDATGSSGLVTLSEETGTRLIDQEILTRTDLEYKETISRECSDQVEVEKVESEVRSSRNFEEGVLTTGVGTKEIQNPAERLVITEVAEIESLSTGTGTGGTMRTSYEPLSTVGGNVETQRPAVDAGSSEQGETPKATEEEECVTAGKGADELGRASEDSENYSLGEVAEEGTEEEIEEIEKPLEEIFSYGDAEVAREEEDVPAGSGVDEIEIVWEEVESFENADTRGVTSNTSGILQAPCGKHEFQRQAETSESSEEIEIVEMTNGSNLLSVAQAYESQQTSQNYMIPVETGFTWLSTHSEAEHLGLEVARTPMRVGSNEPRNWRLEAEKQVMQLSTQLNLLDKQIEEEMELHEKMKSDLQVEHSIDTERLCKQIAFFTDEVTGLRQTIDEIRWKFTEEGGNLAAVEPWAKDLQSKCADQSAKLDHLGKQVGLLDKELNHHLKFRVDIESKLEKGAQERLKVEAQLTDLSKALALTVSTIEKEEEAVGELVEQQRHLLTDQLKEAQKLRDIADVRVKTLNKQIEHLELVCDVAQSIQVVSKYQDKAVKYGLQALFQLFMLALGVITLYSRVAEPLRGSVVPT